MDAQHTNHVTYKLAYHLVWCPKYRKKILVGKLALFIEQEIHRLCEANTWVGGALHVQEDHVHLFRESLLRVLLPRVTGSYPERCHRTPRVSTLPASYEISLGWYVLVSFVLRGQCRRDERGYRAHIDRIGARVHALNASDRRLVFR
jgi:hypothetical protein